MSEPSTMIDNVTAGELAELAELRERHARLERAHRELHRYALDLERALLDRVPVPAQRVDLE